MGSLWRCYSKHTSGKILGLMEWNLTVGILSLLLKFLLRRTLQYCLRHSSSLSGRICGCFQDDYALEEGNHSDLPWLRLSLNCSLESAQVLLWWLESIPWWVHWYQRPSLRLAPVPRIQGRNRYKYQLAKPHSVSLIHWVRELLELPYQME